MSNPLRYCGPMNPRSFAYAVVTAPVAAPAESVLDFTARLWLRTALVVWSGWLGLLGVLLVWV